MKLVYATFPDSEAQKEAENAAVDEKLAACVVSLPVSSCFLWEGEKTREDEVVALFKTTAEHVDALTERIEELHPYDVPCILTLDADANKEYEDWLRDELE